MSLFLARVLILSYVDFINQALCYLSCLVIFVLPSKLYCDIIKATLFYLEHKVVVIVVVKEWK